MIKISDKYIIETGNLDYSAWVFIDGVHPKTKEPTRSKKLIGYYNSVIRALNAIREYEVHKSIGENEIALEGVVSLIKKVDEDFLKALQDVEHLFKEK